MIHLTPNFIKKTSTLLAVFIFTFCTHALIAQSTSGNGVEEGTLKNASVTGAVYQATGNPVTKYPNLPGQTGIYNDNSAGGKSYNLSYLFGDSLGRFGVYNQYRSNGSQAYKLRGIFWNYSDMLTNSSYDVGSLFVNDGIITVKTASGLSPLSSIAGSPNYFKGEKGDKGDSGISAMGILGNQNHTGYQGLAPALNVSDPYWSTVGNAGTVPSTNFIGTTDENDFVIKTNNTEKVRIEKSGIIKQNLPGGAILINGGNANMKAEGNVAIGPNTMVNTTTGSNTVAIGAAVLRYNTTGFHNTAIGVLSMWTNTSGFRNTAIGSRTMYLNTTGYNNTTIGLNSLYSNTSGYYNSALGSTAAYNNTTGIANTAIGASALRTNTTGSYNTAVGYFAQGVLEPDPNVFYSISAVEGNIITITPELPDTLIGSFVSMQGLTGVPTPVSLTAYSRWKVTANNKLTYSGKLTSNATGGTLKRQADPENITVIGSFAVATKSNQAVLGNKTTTSLVIGNNLIVSDAGKTGINTEAPQGALEIKSTIGGVVFPRLTTKQRDAITGVVDGTVLYNTTTNKLQLRAAGMWVDLH